MVSEIKVTKVLSELTRLTSKSQIKWKVSDTPTTLTSGTDDVVPLFIETKYKEQRIGLAQRRYQSYNGENDTLYWTEEVIIVFVDWRDRITWQSNTPHSAIQTLFEAAREQVSNIDEVFDKLLGDDEEL